MVNARTIYERIEELAVKAGLSRQMGPKAEQRQQGFVIYRGGQVSTDCTAVNYAKFGRLVARQFSHRFKLRGGFSDEPTEEMHPPLTVQQLLAEVRKWTKGKGWTLTAFELEPFSKKEREAFVTAVQEALL